MSQKRAARMNKGNGGGKKLTADKRKYFQRESLKWCLGWDNRGNIV